MKLTTQNDSLRSIQEYGVETSLRFPKFLLPFLEKESFIKKYNPTTTLLAAYNYQDMAFYSRTMANATFGYTWNGNIYNTHIVNPVQGRTSRISRKQKCRWFSVAPRYGFHQKWKGSLERRLFRSLHLCSARYAQPRDQGMARSSLSARRRPPCNRTSRGMGYWPRPLIQKKAP